MSQDFAKFCLPRVRRMSSPIFPCLSVCLSHIGNISTYLHYIMVIPYANLIFSVKIWSLQHVSVIIFQYDDHHIIIRWSSYHLEAEKEGTQGNQIWYSCLSFLSNDDDDVMIIMLSYDEHHIITSSFNKRDPTHAISFKRRGLKDIKYDILICHSCHMTIIIQQKRPNICYIFNNNIKEGIKWY